MLIVCVLSTDEMMKSGSYLADNLLDPATATSQEPLDCPFSRVFGRESIFEFFENPENEYRLRRFGAAMVGTRAAFGSRALLTGIHLHFDLGLMALTFSKDLIGSR